MAYRPRSRQDGAIARLCVAVVVFVSVAALAVVASAADPKRAKYEPGEDPGLAVAAERAKQDEAERRARRRAPEAREARRRSGHAYRGQSRAEAIGLAKRELADELLTPIGTKIRLRPGEKLEGYTGTHGARVRDAEGRPGIVQSNTPLLARDAEGRRRPVELGLRDNDSFIAPENPIVPTRFGKDAAGTVRLGDDGLAFRFANPAARADEVTTTEGRAAYTNIAPDTDMWVKPTESGAAAEFVVRSQEAPEALALDFDLPEGTTLKHDPASDSVGIMRGDKPVGAIEPPYAEDAAGERIAVSYLVEGERVTVRVPHRDADLQYPLYVDPTVIEGTSWENSGTGIGTRDWQYRAGPAGSTAPFIGFLGTWGDGWDSSRNGLLLYGYGQANYTHGAFAEWYLTPQRGGIHYPRVDFWTSHRNVSTCAQLGIWGPNNFVSDPPVRQCGDYSIRVDTYCADSGCGYDQGNAGAWVTAALVAWGDGWRNTDLRMMLKTVHVYLWDKNSPNLQPMSSYGTRAWAEQDSVTIGGRAIDGDSLSGDNVVNGGVGLDRVWLKAPNHSGWSGQSTRSQGDPPQAWTPTDETYRYACDGTRFQPCPDRLPVPIRDVNGATQHWGFNWPVSTTNAGLSGQEGHIPIEAWARDFVARETGGSGRDNYKEVVRFRIDRTRPSAMNLGGIATPPNRWFKEGAHPLTLAPKDAHAGVRWQQVLSLPQGEDKPEYHSVRDGFQRTSAGNLGTAEKGGTWRNVDPNASYSTNGSEAVITKSGDGNPMAELQGTNLMDVNGKVKMRFPAPGNGHVTGQLVLRKQPGDWAAPHYRFGIARTASNNISIEGVQLGTNWASKSVFGGTSTGLTQQSANDAFYLRARLIGKSPVRVQVRVWKAGTEEPSTWLVDRSYDPIEVETTQKAGMVGLWTWDNTADAATVWFDELSASTWTEKYSLDRGCTTSGQCPTGTTSNAGDSTASTASWTTSQYEEGAVDFRVKAADPLGSLGPSEQGSGSHSLAEDFVAKLDRTLPNDPNTTGSFTQAGAEVPSGQHTLSVTGADARSGVERIQFWVDNQLQDTRTATCSPDCPKSFTTNPEFVWDTRNLADKSYDLKVVVRDAAGNERTKSWSVYVDGTRPETSVSGTLWTKEDQIVAEPSYDVVVDTGDGEATAEPNSGVRRIEIRVDGNLVWSADQTCTARNCAMQRAWDFNTASYTQGSHRVEVTAIDRADNRMTDEVNVIVRHVPNLPPDTKPLAANSWMRLDGATAGEAAGRSVATTGDVDKDGVTDYAVGAPAANNNARALSGSVYVVYGSSTSGPLDLANLGSRGFRIDGATAGDRAGTAVAPAGDVNADGYMDLVIGSPGPDAALQGRAHVVFGAGRANTPATIDLASLGSRGFAIAGPVTVPDLTAVPADSFGASLSGRPDPDSTGDVNGDGRDDVVIGFGAAGNNGTGSGSAYVIFGKTDSNPVDAAALGSSGFRIDGAGTGHHAGRGAVIAGDASGDGAADVALTAPGLVGPNRTDGGGAYVVFGKPNANNVALSSLGTAGYPIYGTTGDGMGSSITGLGDADDDTLDDVAIGGNGAWVALGQDVTTPIDFAAQDVSGYRTTAPVGTGYTASQVGPAGDVNGDAVPDVLVGFPDAANGAGSTYSVVSQPGLDTPTAPIALGTLGGARGTRFDGAGAERAGTAVAGTPSTVADDSGIVVAAPNAANNSRPGSGSVYVVRSDSTSGDLRAAQTQQPPPNDRARDSRGCYTTRNHPYYFDDPNADFPKCRLTVKGKTDVTPFASKYGYRNAGRGYPQLRGKTYGQSRLDMKDGLRLRQNATDSNRRRWPLVDSFETPIGFLEHRGAHGFTLFDTARNEIARSPKGSNVELRLEGRGCMNGLSGENAHAFIVLYHDDTLSRATVGNKDIGIRAFIPRAALPPNAFIRRDDRHPDWPIPPNDNVIDRYYVPCNTTRGVSRTFTERVLEVPPFAEQEVYVSRNRQTGPNACRQVDGCGTPYDNYINPPREPAQNLTPPRFPDMTIISNSTTGVHGGALSRGVFINPRASRIHDEIGYTDHNVPCNRPAVARWYLANINPTGSRPIYGWVPQREPDGYVRRPTQPAGSPWPGSPSCPP